VNGDAKKQAELDLLQKLPQDLLVLPVPTLGELFHVLVKSRSGLKRMLYAPSELARFVKRGKTTDTDKVMNRSRQKRVAVAANSLSRYRRFRRPCGGAGCSQICEIAEIAMAYRKAADPITPPFGALQATSMAKRFKLFSQSRLWAHE
jgi:hypothetical protein